MKISKLLPVCLCAALAIGLFTRLAMAEGGKESQAQYEARMAWWRQAKFGLFIHWGVYSSAGGEWKGQTNHTEWLQLTAKIPIKQYTELAQKFNPVKFDAKQWVKIARDAGMKYIVITSKHHDGFAMYDSPSNPYNIVKTSAYHHDPLKDLAEACRKEGLKFCVYYSLGRDWHDPDVSAGNPPGSRSNLVDFPDESKKDFSKYFERKVKPQVRELLTQYGPIGIFWFDTPEKISKEQSRQLRVMIHALQPRCIVNERIGHGQGDYRVAEQQILGEVSTTPWETCMTLNRHWGYNKADQNWKSSQDLHRNLVDIVSKGGNFLLNVGPTGEGIIPQPSVQRLEQIGAWLKINGESIYGAGPTLFGPELGSYDRIKKEKHDKPIFNPVWEWRRTTKPGKIYIHLFKWPEGQFELANVKLNVIRAYLLAEPRQALTMMQSDGKVTIKLPMAAPDHIDSVLCLETER